MVILMMLAFILDQKYAQGQEKVMTDINGILIRAKMEQ